MENSEREYEMVCEDRDGYLLVRVTDTAIPLTAAIDLTNRTMEHFRANGYKRVIVSTDIPMRMTDRQLAMFGNIVANMLPADGRMAFVDKTASRENVHRIVVQEAKKRGRAVKAFDSIDQAREWILSE